MSYLVRRQVQLKDSIAALETLRMLGLGGRGAARWVSQAIGESRRRTGFGRNLSGFAFILPDIFPSFVGVAPWGAEFFFIQYFSQLCGKICAHQRFRFPCHGSKGGR